MAVGEAKKHDVISGENSNDNLDPTHPNLTTTGRQGHLGQPEHRETGQNETLKTPNHRRQRARCPSATTPCPPHPNPSFQQRARVESGPPPRSPSCQLPGRVGSEPSSGSPSRQLPGRVGSAPSLRPARAPPATGQKGHQHDVGDSLTVASGNGTAANPNHRPLGIGLLCFSIVSAYWAMSMEIENFENAGKLPPPPTPPTSPKN